MSNVNQTIYVAVFEHRHGVDVFVYRTEEQAEALRQRIASDYWEQEMPDGVERPDDPEEMADAYFGEMGDHGEYFHIHPTLLQGDCAEQQS